MAVRKESKQVPYEPGKLPELLDVRDVQRELRIGKTTVYKLVSEGVLEKAKFGTKTLFSRESVERAIASAISAGKV